MELPILHDANLIEELKRLDMPRLEKLATCMKNNYGLMFPDMRDEDWLTDAAELLEVLELEGK
jgi:hypothetical protein